MRHLGIFGRDKEKCSSSLVVYFHNRWSCEALKFWFCQEIKILVKSKRGINSSEKLGRNVIYLDRSGADKVKSSSSFTVYFQHQ